MGLERLPWWPRWESEAKAICQWVHARPRREFLQSRLGGFPDIFKPLDSGLEKFADWRWRTLTNVTEGLIRTQAALVHATTDMCASDLSSRDGVQAQTFLTSVQSPLFWQQRHALEALARPVATFSGWLRGCACHGAKSMSPECVSCPWKRVSSP